MTTIHVFTKEFKRLKFESVEKAVAIEPILIVEEIIDENDTKQYAYNLFDHKGDRTKKIQVGKWKLISLEVVNGGSYPSISFEIVDPIGEIKRHPILGDRGIWAFARALGDLREANEYSDYRTYEVYRENKRLQKEVTRLNAKIESLEEKIKGKS